MLSKLFFLHFVAQIWLAGYHSNRRQVWVDVTSISGLVVEYIVAIDVTRVRFPADASMCCAVRHVSIVLGGWSAITARRALDRQIRYSLAG